MKVGDLVRRKDSKRLGLIYKQGLWKNWMVIYWFDDGCTNQHIKHALEVVHEG